MVVPSAFARSAAVPVLHWTSCGDAGALCTTAWVPIDYDHPDGRKIRLFVAKSPATQPGRRIGSLFYNFGGPGGTASDALEALGADLFPKLNERFDIIAMDPRGVPRSLPALDCHVNQETQGLYRQPFPRPHNLNVRRLIRTDRFYNNRCIRLNSSGILAHLSTANVAHDLDLLRQAVGDPKLTYLGYSYGTFLGATYGALFPDRYRALLLDGPLNAVQYLNDPLANLSHQSTGFEVALGRFLAACKTNQVACAHFGGNNPRRALDRLIARLDRSPLPVPGADPRFVNGDNVRLAIALPLYVKGLWGFLGQALADAQHGDVSMLRLLTDISYGRAEDGSYDPGLDRYYLIGASEQRYPRDVRTYIQAGFRSYREHPHFWWNNGFVELQYGMYPIRDADAYYGPFGLPFSSPKALLVATTFDPATPYGGALGLLRSLGNARLLTMRGDGHTAYPGNSPCIDRAVEAYLIRLVLPPRGKTCVQQVPFEPLGASAARTGADRLAQLRVPLLIRR
ncbi:MAG: hypothetical protein QOJ13_3188 [Gaiellales bacterium]|nr:hypothetical protein [Gaiellales bacterium]